MKKTIERNNFDDSEYVADYGKSALVRLGYTKTMANDIKIEIQNYKYQNVKKILDIGCGVGDLDISLCEVFPYSEITGLDCSIEMLKYAAKVAESTNVSFVNSSIEQFNEESENFDLIVTQYSFEYWDYEKAIPNILRMLKKNGIIYLRNINPEVNEDILSQFLYNNCSSDVEREDFFRYVKSGKTVDECRKILEEYSGLKADILFFKRNSKYNDVKMRNYVKDKTINYNVILKKVRS